MKFRRLLLFISLVFVLRSAQAQFDVHFTHHWAMQGYYNPAFAGSSDRLNIFGTYALQMAGYRHAPKTMLVGADWAIPTEKKHHAVGAMLTSESIGLFSNQQLKATYAFRFKLGKGRLAVGASAGMLQQKFDGSKVDAEDKNDDALPTSSVEGKGFDLSAGVHYIHKKFYVGFSGMHLLAPTIKLGETNEIKVDPSLYLAGGCNISLKNPLLSIQPSVQVITDLQAWRADLTVRGTYRYDGRSYYLGLTYSPLASVSFLIGGEINHISFGYAYELFTSGVGAAQGSHDIYVGYVMDIDLFKKSKNKHKSIRIL